jgi:hypothetical protein
MSAQGLNSTAYSGFQYVPGGIPIRDASDYTKTLKQRSVYRQYSASGVPDGYVDHTIVQSNQVRLSYNFGRLVCSSCQGPFPNLPVGGT